MMTDNTMIGAQSVDLDRLGTHMSRRIRVFSDFPRAGIAFQDLCGVFADPGLLQDLSAAIVNAFADEFDHVLAIEARGFVLGTALACHSGRPLVLARKAGKLPGPVHRVEYDLEYGSAALEIQRDALPPGDRVLVVDDVLATGGTLAAARALVEASGAGLVGHAVLVELAGLGGAERLAPHRLFSILTVAA